MTSRSVRINPNQESLFLVNEQTGILHPHVETTPPLAGANPLEDPNPGPAVNLLERNAHLQNMLRRFGVMSRTVGLQKISENGLRSKLEDRYDDVDRVVGGAVDNQPEKDLEARREYAKAFGLEAMIGSGLMPAEEARTTARESFRKEVIPTFADAKGERNRDAMKRWLNYQERSLMGKRTRRPTVPLPKHRKVV